MLLSSHSHPRTLCQTWTTGRPRTLATRMMSIQSSRRWHPAAPSRPGGTGNGPCRTLPSPCVVRGAGDACRGTIRQCGPPRCVLRPPPSSLSLSLSPGRSSGIGGGNGLMSAAEPLNVPLRRRPKLKCRRARSLTFDSSDRNEMLQAVAAPAPVPVPTTQRRQRERCNAFDIMLPLFSSLAFNNARATVPAQHAARCFVLIGVRCVQIGVSGEAREMPRSSHCRRN